MGSDTGKARRITLGKRLRYSFDNLMARGAIGQFALLALISLAIAVVVVFFTMVVAQLGGSEDTSLAELVARTGMLILVPDPVDLGEDGPLLFLSGVAAIFGGLMVGAALIGILDNAIGNKVESLRRGRSFVAERNHTVILGWSSTIFRVVDEICVANENHPGQCIAILAPEDSVEMNEALADQVDKFRKTRVVCRNGNPIVTSDLELVNLHAARSIIVLSPEDKADPDSLVIKVLLTVAHLTRDAERDTPVTVELRDSSNQEVCRIIAEDKRIEVVALVSDVLIPRLLVQSCRQAGLSYVYSDLLDFDGDEIYFRPISEMQPLVGKTFREVCFAFEDSTIIGLVRDGQVLINPLPSTVCTADDQVISISEDDDTTIPAARPAPAPNEASIFMEDPAEPTRPERNLILGWTEHIFAVINELDEYMTAGSSLLLVSTHPTAEKEITERCSGVKNMAFAFSHGDIADRSLLESLPFEDIDNVMVIPNCPDDLSCEEIDAVTIKCLVHVRDIARKRRCTPSITSQILSKASSDVAATTRLGDFVVGDEIIGRIIAQLAENAGLEEVFEDLLTAEGSEIYIKPVERYIKPDTSVDFYTVLEATLRRNEIAIGVVRGHEIEINPRKTQKFEFFPGDRLIVMAEDLETTLSTPVEP